MTWDLPMSMILKVAKKNGRKPDMKWNMENKNNTHENKNNKRHKK